MKIPFLLTLTAVALLTTSRHGLGADEDPVVSGKKVSEWIADLKSGDRNKVIRAAQEMENAGEKAKAALPALIQLLGGNDRNAVYYASKALEKFGADGAAVLVVAATWKDEKLSKTALGILRSKYPEASEKAGFGSVSKDLVEMKKFEASTTLKGTSWLVYITASSTAATTSLGVVDSGASQVSIGFDDKNAMWTYLGIFQPKPGKASYTIDTGRSPARLELKVGNDVFKGIYEITKAKDGLVNMKLEFGGKGDDYPAKFFEGFTLPKGSKNMVLHLTRVK